jgi:hypothetical protein
LGKQKSKSSDKPSNDELGFAKRKSNIVSRKGCDSIKQMRGPGGRRTSDISLSNIEEAAEVILDKPRDRRSKSSDLKTLLWICENEIIDIHNKLFSIHEKISNGQPITCVKYSRIIGQLYTGLTDLDPTP